MSRVTTSGLHLGDPLKRDHSRSRPYLPLPCPGRIPQCVGEDLPHYDGVVHHQERGCFGAAAVSGLMGVQHWYVLSSILATLSGDRSKSRFHKLRCGLIELCARAACYCRTPSKAQLVRDDFVSEWLHDVLVGAQPPGHGTSARSPSPSSPSSAAPRRYLGIGARIDFTKSSPFISGMFQSTRMTESAKCLLADHVQCFPPVGGRADFVSESIQRPAQNHADRPRIIDNQRCAHGVSPFFKL
jgi:hypothetical protein